MGSSQNKDPLLFIYISLNKRFYYAGETVEGAVHVDCKGNRPYTKLCLRIHGSEKINWTEFYNNMVLDYNNFKETYLELLPLAQFQSGISTGQYTFPFSILLPSTLPGSFQMELDNYIRYTITAFFPSNDSKSIVPQFKRPLHIREPPRTTQQGFKIQSLAQAECCSCCCVCGQVDLTLESSASVLMYGEKFLARGKIDNTNGTTKIKSFKVVLRQTTKQVSSSGNVNQTDAKEFTIYECPNSVPSGTALPFDIQINVPKDVVGHTAIGSIIYRAYFLDLVAEVNCCYSNPRVGKHIIFNTSIQPPVDEEEMTKAPQGWSPIVKPPVSFLNLKPYIYVPSPFIDVRNQLGQNIAYNNANSNYGASPFINPNNPTAVPGLPGYNALGMNQMFAPSQDALYLSPNVSPSIGRLLS